MPSQRITGELEKCKKALFQLFIDQVQLQGINHHLNQLHRYYSRLIDNAEYCLEEDEVIEEYWDFINQLSQVKQGNMTAQEAMDQAEELMSDKDCGSLCDELFKLCEVIFWGTVACIGYVSCAAIGMPLILCEPLLGVALTLSTLALAMMATDVCLETMEDFELYAGHNEALGNQKGLLTAVSMFKKTDAKKESAQPSEPELPPTYPSMD
ncbi:DUF5638 domain-containing protein [Legionella waltersii]|uniref:DUF5638 domain-containing protein n=1 Tax=Legionella waltersii TaxID=66969 RepID=A0A0W1A008_9GAMM|nr:DUF5638 domain-containing protein [Legionella waltersii]KTD74695.1 hypothetical protein Lwal_2736 [Legionella waltersii]SNV09267.1 Uncharacterised protein [Legionella waltersii]